MLPSLVFGSVTSEDVEELTPAHFAHLIPLAQACLDYMLHQANASGAVLVRRFHYLCGVWQTEDQGRSPIELLWP